MKNESKFRNICIVGYICLSVLIFALVLIIPQSREVFKTLSAEHPYIMGFIKFALLATSGELIAAFIANGNPTVPIKIIWRFIIWGLIGVWITFMMKVYSFAAIALMANGLLPGGNNVFLKALYTSVMMNTSFGPTFMAVHKCTDKIIELKSCGEKATVKNVICGIDWSKFVSFTLFKTVPLFWIPAHTVTFLLPTQYQVMMAAALSVALGIILSLGNRSKTLKEK